MDTLLKPIYSIFMIFQTRKNKSLKTKEDYRKLKGIYNSLKYQKPELYSFLNKSLLLNKYVFFRKEIYADLVLFKDEISEEDMVFENNKIQKKFNIFKSNIISFTSKLKENIVIEGDNVFVANRDTMSEYESVVDELDEMRENIVVLCQELYFYTTEKVY